MGLERRRRRRRRRSRRRSPSRATAPPRGGRARPARPRPPRPAGRTRRAAAARRRRAHGDRVRGLAAAGAVGHAAHRSRLCHLPKGISVSVALITGGAGFIGSNLADAVVADGRACHVVDNLSNGQAIRVPPEARAARDRHPRARRAGGARGERVRPSVIFHLAAQADVRKALEDPAYDADVNVIGTHQRARGRPRGRRPRGVRLDRRRRLRRVRGAAGALARDGRDPPALPLRHEQDGRRGLLRRSTAASTARRPSSCASATSTARVRTPTARPASSRSSAASSSTARARGSSATGSRPATTSTSATSCARSSPPRPASRGRRSTSAPAWRRACSTCSTAWATRGRSSSPTPGRASCSAAPSTRPSAGRVYGWRPEMPLAEGLKATLESVIAARRAPDARPPGAFATA